MHDPEPGSSTAPRPSRLLVQLSPARWRAVDLGEIYLVEADGDDCRVRLRREHPLTDVRRLADLEELLELLEFVQKGSSGSTAGSSSRLLSFGARRIMATVTSLEEVLQMARKLSTVDKVRLIEKVSPEIERELVQEPLESQWGLLSGLGEAPSAEEIARAREEMWGSFARADV